MVVVGQLVAGKRMFFQDQVADFKAASMIQQAKKELWAELIKAMAAWLLHMVNTNSLPIGLTMFMQLAMATGKLKTCSRLPPSMTAL
jgi:hypothetical protein